MVMRLLDKNEPMMNSGHCAICGFGVDRNATDILVDTLYDLDLPPGDLAGGRKYVCQGCVFDLARLCGFMRPDEVNDFKQVLAEFQQRYQSFVAQVVSAVDAFPTLDSAMVPAVPSLVNEVPAAAIAADLAEAKSEAPKRGRPKKEAF